MSTVSHCRNHPYVEATCRCKRCNIPLCDQCKVVPPEGGIYCSEVCRAQMQAFMDRAKDLPMDVRRPRSLFRILRWVIFIVILGVVLFVLRFRFDVRNFGDLRDFVLRIIRRT